MVLNQLMSEPRKYLKSHPWLTFAHESITSSLTQGTWLKLGECFSKCQHLLGAPISPGKAQEISQIYMRRGAWATAQIEGNTLTESQLDGLLDNTAELPESQQYLEQEITNVLAALAKMEEDISKKKSTANDPTENFRITPSWIKEVNAQLLEGLVLEDHVTPGEYRDVPVGVMRYPGAPSEDIEYLMDKFCTWINKLLDNARENSETRDPIINFSTTFIVAVLSHLYFAWIHPFGDGNGRTARLVECAILANSEFVPWVSTNILSDYYNKTRSIYYQKLEAASVRSDVTGFVQYSVEGFREQIKNQVARVQLFQRHIAWVSYIHESFPASTSTEKSKRLKELALNMSEEEPLAAKEMLTMNGFIKAIYIKHTPRTFKRDLDELVSMGLVEKVDPSRYRAKIQVMDGFKPLPELGSH